MSNSGTSKTIVVWYLVGSCLLVMVCIKQRLKKNKYQTVDEKCKYLAFQPTQTGVFIKNTVIINSKELFMRALTANNELMEKSD